MNSLNNRARLRMTSSEIAMGRFMRAPDHADAEFAEFEAADSVEVGASNLASEDEAPKAKPEKAKPEKAKPAAEGEQEFEMEGQGDEGDEEDLKPKKSPKDHQLERLKREKADLARQLRETEQRTQQEMLARMERLENRLQGGNSGDSQEIGTLQAPDPSDAEKYPLGYLDDRYIEDKLEWLAESKATKRADAVLQRQQEIEQQESQQQMQTQLLDKVDSLSTRGTEQYDDFQESVVEAGMRGDWDLSQPTFEASHEAENGVQILYELAQDKAEASRVAKLTPYQQLKYVADRDAEISKGKTPRRIPRAGDPPQNTARGANSRTQISPATDNLDDFEKAWEADARRSNR